jgi:hypothetical protein
VKLLLADQRVDPSAENYEAFIEACRAVDVKILQLLLADQRVVPPLLLLLKSIELNRIEVVKFLLTDQRFNSVQSRHQALITACTSGNGDVVDLLLADDRLDPSENGQAALTATLSNNSWYALKRLLADQRVDEIGNPFASEANWIRIYGADACSLFLLRKKRRDRSLLPDAIANDEKVQKTIIHIDKIEAQRKGWLSAHLIPDLVDLCLEYVPDLFCHSSPLFSSWPIVPDSDWVGPHIHGFGRRRVDFGFYLYPLESLSTL